MFVIQRFANSATETKEVLPPCEHARVFKDILNHWKASADMQQKIVSSGKIPMMFCSSDYAEQISGISYELEETDLAGLLSEFKKDTRPFRIPGFTEDEAVNLLHDVFRVLRSAVKQAAKPAPQAEALPVRKDVMYVSRR